MFDIVVPNEGASYLLRRLVKQQPADADDWQLALFQNDYEPAANTTAADFVECTFSGYARLSLAKATWNDPAIVAGKARTVYGPAPVVFTNVGVLRQVAFGFWVKRAASPLVVFCQRFDVPKVLEGSSEVLFDLPFTFRTDVCGSGS